MGACAHLEHVLGLVPMGQRALAGCAQCLHARIPRGCAGVDVHRARHPDRDAVQARPGQHPGCEASCMGHKSRQAADIMNSQQGLQKHSPADSPGTAVGASCRICQAMLVVAASCCRSSAPTPASRSTAELPQMAQHGSARSSDAVRSTLCRPCRQLERVAVACTARLLPLLAAPGRRAPLALLEAHPARRILLPAGPHVMGAAAQSWLATCSWSRAKRACQGMAPQDPGSQQVVRWRR